MLYLYDWQGVREGTVRYLDVNSFAFITRIYAENSITLTDLFDELADSLDSQLDNLREDGFVDAYISLTLSRLQASIPSGYKQADLDVTIEYGSNNSSLRQASAAKNRHRTALADLEDMLYGNMDRLSLDALADLCSFCMTIVKQSFDGKMSNVPDGQIYDNQHGRLANMLAGEIIKLLRQRGSDETVSMQALAQLYHAFSCRFYLIYGGNEEMRRSGLDEDFLEPFKLIGDLIEKFAPVLGDEDLI